MNNNNNNNTILASSLFQLCKTKSSGTLFILTSDNSSAQFILNEGAITAFSFDNKHDSSAIELFKNAGFSKSQFLENYEFPLTRGANISCSDCLLNQLGHDEFLIDQYTWRRKKSHIDCLNDKIFENELSGFAA